MFGYLSLADLSSLVRENIARVPLEADLVVGIPRSGMIPAYLIGLYLNRHVMALEQFLADGAVGHGVTRRVGREIQSPLQARHVLLVDDSASSGASIRKSLARVREAGFSGKVTTCAMVVVPSAAAGVDLFFQVMPQPRVFEWNAFHHPELKNSCFDIDGLLCVDPTDQQNDDGERYLEFLKSARPLHCPTLHIGHIVTSRLQKYREPTAQWLKANGISYGKLHMLDLATREERVRLGAHATHKAKVYRETDTILFYESDAQQSADIAAAAGKPVLCTTNMVMYRPGNLHVRALARNAKWHLRRPLGRVKGWMRKRLQPQ